MSPGEGEIDTVSPDGWQSRLMHAKVAKVSLVLFTTSTLLACRSHPVAKIDTPQAIMTGYVTDPASSGARLEPAVIQGVVRAAFQRYRTCYASGMTRNPSLTGVVRVRFVIEPDGMVSNAGDAGGSTLPDVDVIDCVAREFRVLSFPKPVGGRVEVVYPILFNPGP